MKIVFNTNNKKNPAYQFYSAGLKMIKEISFNNHGNYKNFDYALFVSYPEDMKMIKEAKTDNPNIKIGLLDPKSHKLVYPYINLIDFFIVDSLEMYDFWINYGKPAHIYYEYPYFEKKLKSHKEKEKVIIGYHGNKVHLTSMFPNITNALEIVSEKYDIEFWAIYNIEQVGIWNIGVPKNVFCRHIQWNSNVYEEELSKVDIGILPSLIPIKKNTLKRSIVSKFFLNNEDDYLLRFKMLSNPGRLITFSRLGIPIIAELSPSNIEFIKNGVNGFIAYSTGAWVNSLSKLISSSRLRNELSNNMDISNNHIFEFSNQNKKLINFLKNYKICNNAYNHNELIGRKNTIFERIKFNNSYIIDLFYKIKKRLIY